MQDGSAVYLGDGAEHQTNGDAWCVLVVRPSSVGWGRSMADRGAPTSVGVGRLTTGGARRNSGWSEVEARRDVRVSVCGGQRRRGGTREIDDRVQ
jgi:hypothetical protein